MDKLEARGIAIPDRKRRISLQEENAQFVRTRSRRYQLAKQAGYDDALCYEIANGTIELAEADEQSAKRQRR